MGNWALATVIITYQEKSGNYNAYDCVDLNVRIITYQEKSGNYNIVTFVYQILRL